MRIATVEQVVTIGDRMPSRYRALVLVAACSRLRWEELVGLRRKRIDLEAGTVTVDEQLVEVNGTFSVGPPKSAAGRRTVLRVHDLCLPPAPWPPPPTARYARPCTGWATPQP
jgi:integrase